MMNRFAPLEHSEPIITVKRIVFREALETPGACIQIKIRKCRPDLHPSLGKAFSKIPNLTPKPVI
jgi:hypothetical protein